MKHLTLTTILATLSTLLPLTTCSAIPAADPTLTTNSSANINVPRQAFDITRVPTDTNNKPVCCPIAEWNWPIPSFHGDPYFAIAQLKRQTNGFYSTSNECDLAQCMYGAGIWFCSTTNSIEEWLIDAPLLATFSQTLWDSCHDGCGQFFPVKGQPYNVVMHAC